MSTVAARPALEGDILAIDCEAEAKRIGEAMVAYLRANRRRGYVIALSGGVDSSVCAALAARAVGAQRLYGLMLPERDSSGNSLRRAQLVTTQFGIEHAVEDISPALDGLGC